MAEPNRQVQVGEPLFPLGPHGALTQDSAKKELLDELQQALRGFDETQLRLDETLREHGRTRRKFEENK